MRITVDEQGHVTEGSPTFLGDIGETVVIPPDRMAEISYTVRPKFFGCPECQRHALCSRNISPASTPATALATALGPFSPRRRPRPRGRGAVAGGRLAAYRRRDRPPKPGGRQPDPAHPASR